MKSQKSILIKITKAKLPDAVKIYKLGKETHELDFSRKYPFHELSEVKEFITNPKENVFLVAKSGEEVIGFVFAKILSHHAGGWCMLDNLCVKKSFRHRGIGEKLLKSLYTEIKKRKVWYLQILEEAHHKKTRAFWKKMGYSETKTFIWAEKSIR
ncbi:MAG: GNAT family N-acetyltransferase [archaeon]